MGTLLEVPSGACVLGKRQIWFAVPLGVELLSVRLQDGGWGQAGLDMRTTPGSGPGQSFSIISASDVDGDTGVGRIG